MQSRDSLTMNAYVKPTYISLLSKCDNMVAGSISRGLTTGAVWSVAPCLLLPSPMLPRHRKYGLAEAHLRALTIHQRTLLKSPLGMIPIPHSQSSRTFPGVSPALPCSGRCQPPAIHMLPPLISSLPPQSLFVASIFYDLDFFTYVVLEARMEKLEVRMLPGLPSSSFWENSSCLFQLWEVP